MLKERVKEGQGMVRTFEELMALDAAEIELMETNALDQLMSKVTPILHCHSSRTDP